MTSDFLCSSGSWVKPFMMEAVKDTAGSQFVLVCVSQTKLRHLLAKNCTHMLSLVPLCAYIYCWQMAGLANVHYTKLATLVSRCAVSLHVCFQEKVKSITTLKQRLQGFRPETITASTCPPTHAVLSPPPPPNLIIQTVGSLGRKGLAAAQKQ